MFKLGTRSNQRLVGVHDDLCKVVRRAIKLTEVDFTVLEGLRSVKRQKVLLAAGASTTMNSRHLTGHAVDLGAWVDGQVAWGWPLYHKISEAMYDAAAWLDIKIEWGGAWTSFPDGPHFQLPWIAYPPDPTPDEPIEA
ncbi:MAG: M15 family metallopeptidase [Geminicoccaceae bacterium]